jgi:hypothetical protein
MVVNTDFKTLVSCASNLGDSQGEYSSLEPISSNFSSVSSWHIVQFFLSQ